VICVNRKGRKPRALITYQIWQRFDSLRLALGLVQTTGVEVADLLFVAALDGISFFRSLFQNVMQGPAIILGENVEAAPRRVSRRNLRVLEPRAVGILIKVRSGRRVLVHAGQIITAALTKHGDHAKSQEQRERNGRFLRVPHNSSP
jgi:hypothetical protein